MKRFGIYIFTLLFASILFGQSYRGKETKYAYQYNAYYTVDGFDSLGAALTKAASDTATLLIPDVIGLSTDDTVDANVTLDIPMGGKISPGNAKTLHLDNCYINAGRYQIFGPNLTITGKISNEVCFPEWWGVVGDGSTDNETNHERAIDANICRHMSYKPWVTYMMKKITFDSSGVKYVGHFTTLKCECDSAYSIYFCFINGDSCTFEGLTWDGNRNHPKHDKTNFNLIHDDDAAATHCITMKNCAFKGSEHYGINIDSPWYWYFENCRWDSIDYVHLRLHSGRSNKVIGCTFTLTREQEVNSSAIFIDTYYNKISKSYFKNIPDNLGYDIVGIIFSTDGSNPCQGNVVEGNTFEGDGNIGGSHGISGTNSTTMRGNSIYGNHFNNLDTGIEAYWDWGTITVNTFYGCKDAIISSGPGTIISFNVLKDSRSIRPNGGKSIVWGNLAWGDSYGIRTSAADNIIGGNLLGGSSVYEIRLDESADDNLIALNFLQDVASSSGSSYPHVIYFSGAGDGNVFTNNMVGSDSSDVPTNFIKGIAGSDSNYVKNNYITNISGAVLSSLTNAASGRDSFSGTAVKDTVLIPGAKSTDSYTITFLGSAADAQDVPKWDARNDSLIVVRPADGASGAEYRWEKSKEE